MEWSMLLAFTLQPFMVWHGIKEACLYDNQDAYVLDFRRTPGAPLKDINGRIIRFMDGPLEFRVEKLKCSGEIKAERVSNVKH